MRIIQVRQYSYCLFVIAFFFGAQPELKANEGRKYAFLIGLKDYPDGESNGRFGPLPFTENDISRMYLSLLDLGFEKENIRIYSDAKELEKMSFVQESSVVINRIDHMESHKILKNLKDFVTNKNNKIGPGDTLLVYLTGHGSVFNYQRYFAVRTTDPDTVETYIAIDKIVLNMSYAYGANKLLLVDTCANINVSTDGLIGDRALLNKVNIYQIFSSQIGEVSRFDPDPSIEMSIFSYYLVKAFKEADIQSKTGDGDAEIETNEIYHYVKDRVMAHPIPNYEDEAINSINSLQEETHQIPDQLGKGGAFSIGYVYNECNSYKQKKNESDSAHSKRVNSCVARYE